MSIVALTLPMARAQSAASAPDEPESSVPFLPGLKTQVEFWKQVFATYSTRQVVIHDALHLQRIYAVLDFRPLADSGASDAEIEAYARDQVQSEKERVRAALLHLHQVGPESPELTAEERRVGALFADVKDPMKFLQAAADDRIRSQWGLRERFAAGVEMSRRYLPRMEVIFRREGLPVELTRLPLIESCFNVRAYSKVGAAGIWQLMPATARRYMAVNRAVDERRDPITSTRAAALYLKENYEVLGNWPLAVTAYNHGRAGMVNAVSTLGSSDLVEIIRHYHGPAFKFASRNFYAEFLAALDVERNFEDNFGDIHPHRPLLTEAVAVPDYVNFRVLAKAANTEADTLAELNPGLTRDVVSGRLLVPKGHVLQVPAGTAANFRSRYAALGVKHRQPPARRSRCVTHRVQRGQTLASIAKRYRTTVAAIQRRNNLRGTSRLRAGQSLVIPTG